MIRGEKNLNIQAVYQKEAEPTRSMRPTIGEVHPAVVTDETTFQMKLWSE